MDIFTFLVDLVIGLWFLAVIVAIVRALQARSAKLVPLSLETRDRFVASWYRITAGFVDAPREAVQQADALVVSLLRETGRPVLHERVPKPIQEARNWTAHENKTGTEALRQAMLHYRSMFTRAIGHRPQETRKTEPDLQESRRREMA